jgi:hypothetical protein
MVRILSFFVLLSFPAQAHQECPPDFATFCVVYNGKVRNMETNECVLKQAKNITELHQGLCNTIPNAQ